MNGTLFPEIVLDLQQRGVTHTYRPSSRDVLVQCPCCRSNMLLDAGKPYWLCLGRRKCESDSLGYAGIIRNLGRAS